MPLTPSAIPLSLRFLSRSPRPLQAMAESSHGHRSSSSWPPSSPRRPSMSSHSDDVRILSKPTNASLGAPLHRHRARHRLPHRRPPSSIRRPQNLPELTVCFRILDVSPSSFPLIPCARARPLAPIPAMAEALAAVLVAFVAMGKRRIQAHGCAPAAS